MKRHLLFIAALALTAINAYCQSYKMQVITKSSGVKEFNVEDIEQVIFTEITNDEESDGDNKEEPLSPSTLIGEWVVIDIEVDSPYSGTTVNGAEVGDHLIFFENGTCKVKGNENSYAKWEFVGDKLKLYGNPNYLDWVADCSISDNKLIIKYEIFNIVVIMTLERYK